jgi:3-mercaptopyruvate sulfurtransferase SseA
VALELMALGRANVHVLLGGWKAWESGGYPVEPK